MTESNRQPGPWTLFTAIAVIAMLAVAVTGVVYTVHLLLTLPAKP